MVSSQNIDKSILRFLAQNGLTPVHELKLPFLSYGDSTYCRHYRSLVDKKLIAEERAAGQTVARLTRSGMDYVRSRYPGIKIATAPARSDKEKLARQICMAAARAVMAGAAITALMTKKPTLIDLDSDNDDIRKKAEEQFLKILKHGVFYSASEIKKWLDFREAGGDTFFKARLAGILLVPDQAYFVYSIGNKLIRMSTHHDKALCSTIVERMSEIPVFQECFSRYRVNGPWSCLIIADRKGMLPKIWFGCASGKSESTRSTQEKRRLARWKKIHCTYSTLSELFDSIYFISTTKAGAEILKVLVTGPEKAICQLSPRYQIEQYDPSDVSRIYFDHDTKTVTFLLPDLDISELRNFLDSLEDPSRGANFFRISLIAPEYFADPLSRCLGIRLKEFKDSKTGNGVMVYRYTREGYPNDDSYMKGLRGFMD